MLYSSGTTAAYGHCCPFPAKASAGTRISQALAAQYHFTENSYLSRALTTRHLAYSIGAQSLGATVVMMESSIRKRP